MHNNNLVRSFKEMRDHPTFVKVSEICEKVGYTLDSMLRIGNRNGHFLFILINDHAVKDDVNYYPAIYLRHGFLQNSCYLEIYTPMEHSFSPDEYWRFIEAQKQAYEMVNKLKDIIKDPSNWPYCDHIDDLEKD